MPDKEAQRGQWRIDSLTKGTYFLSDQRLQDFARQGNPPIFSSGQK